MAQPTLSLRHRPSRLAIPAAQRSDISLDDLLSCIREVVREELHAFATSAGTESATFVDKHTSGIGPSVFLAAARAGEFETFRVGKRFVAREADVRAYIERQRVTRTPAARRLDELDVQLAGRVKRARKGAADAATNPSAPPKKVG